MCSTSSGNPHLHCLRVRVTEGGGDKRYNVKVMPSEDENQSLQHQGEGKEVRVCGGQAE